MKTGRAVGWKPNRVPWNWAKSVDWLFRVLRPAQEFFIYMETSPLPVKGCKFRPMLGAQGLWAGRDLYHAPAVTRDLGFSGLIRRTVPFSRLLRHTRGCGGSILTRILKGTGRWWFCVNLIPFYGIQDCGCEVLKNILPGGEFYFHFQTVNLPCSLIFDVRYLENESRTSIKVWSC
jgi:hypothetical protein